MINNVKNWFLGLVTGLFVSYVVLSPSDADKEKLRMEGYDRARAQLVSSQPATQPTIQATQPTTRESPSELMLKADKAVERYDRR